MAFRDYSQTPASNTLLADGTYIGPNMVRNKVRPALQRLAADGKALSDDFDARTLLEQGPPGTNALAPNFVVQQGEPGSGVVTTGTYPNITITIGPGTPGASGALGDGVYGDISVSGGGLVLTVRDGVITTTKMADMATGFLGRSAGAAGAPSALTVAAARSLLVIDSVDNTTDAAKPLSTAATAAIAAKRNLAPNEQTIVTAASVTPTSDNDQVMITAQAGALTMANPTGTPANGWGIMIRIKDNGIARTIAYGTSYRAIGITLPTTTIATKTLYLGMIYNSAAGVWDVVSLAMQA